LIIHGLVNDDGIELVKAKAVLGQVFLQLGA
jgi:hypothetical protein